eukprot:snap_masked-scaffold51_size454968-processed-gene-3.10 protein:Tk05770 transcript:snap_masked-scaffold51_size454968-processed-gene-3.10-mRNA-1 annotation:"predicted protein"
MERLIRSGFPYRALRVQNRMRPEFAEMLLDIYPNLETNLKRVAQNLPLDCLKDSMFFWTHTHAESQTPGSKTNAEEAEMAMALAAFIMFNGIEASRITILAPYLGQTKLIQSLLWDKLSGILGPRAGVPSVQTINMFQGDENDFIILSLVRSNEQGSIGFLDSLNRRCVAQSRAKCGLYFIGNESTLIQTSGVWKELVNHMKTSDCLGPRITIQCSKHQDLSQKPIENAPEMIDIIKSFGIECLECRKTQAAYQARAQKKVQKQARQRAAELKKKISKSPRATFQIRSLLPTDPEFYQVQDQVTKYVQSMHNWSPTITQVEVVINYERERAFELCRAEGFKDYSALKFHGTTEAGIHDIPKNGFREPNPNPANGKRGMYGQGIYFATDSSKSAQHIYTGGSNRLLLCNVFLGQALTLTKSDNTMDYAQLRLKKCDSVFAPRGTAVKNDEFVVYNRDQALVKYIIHFLPNGMPNNPMTIPQRATRRRIDPSRTIDLANPDEYLFRVAESCFYRGSSGELLGRSIDHIEYVVNPALEINYQAKRQEFKAKKIPTDEIYAFHGTKPANIDSILKTNLSLSYAKAQMYGRGNYLSEFPGVSLGYGMGLILFKVMPGNEYEGSADSWPKHQSKAVRKADDGYGQMIIVEDADQLVPMFVYHLK